nr:HAD-IC family P-type ATPase [Marinithermofilum abyssi]
MIPLERSKRFIRTLPGRIRVEIAALKQNPEAAIYLQRRLSCQEGLLQVKLSPQSGRGLILYDEKKIAATRIFETIAILEQEWLSGMSASPSVEGPSSQEAAIEANMAPDDLPHAAGFQEVAVTRVAEEVPADQIPSSFQTMPQIPQSFSGDRMPPGLIASMGCLALLSTKQLLWGKSAIANSSLPFYLAGAFSIATGYPFLRRGIQKISQQRRWNADLLLGIGALGLALVRENLVVLAGLSILQYINWKHRTRFPEAEDGSPESYLPPEIRQYTEQAGRRGMAIAGATWAFTKSPLRSLAVLLAANPRTASISAPTAWKRAETMLRDENGALPRGGSLPELARTKTVLFDEDSILEPLQDLDIHCLTNDSLSEETVWTVAASLLNKSEHPWREPILHLHQQKGRKNRTAFKVKEADDVIIGTIQQKEYCFGSLSSLQSLGVNCEPFIFRARRMGRKGYAVRLLAQKIGSEFQPVAMLYRREFQIKANFSSITKQMRQHGLEIGVFTRQGIPPEVLKSYGVHPRLIYRNSADVRHGIASLRKEGKGVLWVTPHRLSLVQSNVLTVSDDELQSVLQSFDIAKKTDRMIRQHFRISQWWNAAGLLLALTGWAGAWTINLAADMLSLVFLSRINRLSLTNRQAPSLLEETALREVSATAESALPQSAAFSWHDLQTEDVMQYLGVDKKRGLDQDQVLSRQQSFGLNQLTTRKATPWLITFLEQFKEFTTLLLLGTTALSFFTGDAFHGIAMAVVLLANAAVGALQERKAEKVVETLNQYQPPICQVIRNGKTVELSGTDLVPGDVVILKAGDRIPADLRLMISHDLEVNESVLTGESVSVLKHPQPVSPDTPLAERTNMLYMGTDVTRGRGIGIVVQTGPRTEMGQLVALGKKEKQVTPLQARVTSISKTFVKGALIIGGIVFVVGLLRGISLPQMIATSITLAASAIPEGLPVTVTIALSAGIFRMAKTNTLIRRLSALETMGRTTVICSDKTGTLTKNEITVKKIATLQAEWDVEGDGYQPVGSIRPVGSDTAVNLSEQPEIQRMCQISLLCNNTELVKEEGRWIVKGDPTEGALLTLAVKAGMKEKTDEWKRVHEIPFDSSHGRMTVICRQFENDCYLFSKGSLESILERCTTYQVNGKTYPLTEKEKQQILQKNEAMASQALRVLGFAYRPVTWSEENGCDQEEELIFLGMVGMMDPPKPDVAESIQEAKNLGVRPVMITGDHPSTAIAIAKLLHMTEDEPKILTGQELDRLSDEELEQQIDQISIFARVTPQHKMRIVTAYQKLGHTVAMTGDGVNDTPAIKQADIGIAMGQTGTDVTKETADMVLKHDHFGSIVEAVKEGRTIISNIRKALGCLLTGNLAEIIVTGIAVIAGLPIPLIPIQILLMNLLTDALPAMILAVNPGNKTKETERKDIVDKNLYRKVAIRGALLGAGSLGLFSWHLLKGSSLLTAQTVAFATLVMGQLIQTLSWRREGSAENIRDWSRDRFLLGAMGTSVLALLSVLYLPPLSRFLQTTPLAWRQWIPVLLVSGLISTLSRPLVRLFNRPSVDNPLQMQQQSLSCA